MALTKISRGLLNTGLADSSDATAITISSAEKVTVANSLNAPTSVQTPLIEFRDGDDAIAIADGGAVTMAKVGAIGATTAGTGAFTTLTTSSNLTVGGNLTVTGTSTVVDTVTMNAQNAVVFEGATADGYETTLSVVDPAGSDKTQYLLNAQGYIPVLAAVTTTAITSTPEELNLLDGSVANTVVNSKGVVYGSSGELAGTLSTAAQTNITSLGTLSSLAVSGNQTVGGTLGVTGAITGTLGTAAQTNITSVGTLTGLTVSGATTFNHATNVIQADDSFLRIEEADGTDIVYLGDHTGGGKGAMWLYDHGGTPTVKLTADSHTNWINNGNSLGIGTASPTRKLHVVGDEDLTDFTSTDKGQFCLSNSDYASGEYLSLIHI